MLRQNMPIFIERRGGLGVAENFGQNQNVHAVFNGACGEGMAQTVKIGIRDSRFFDLSVRQILIGSRINRAAVGGNEHIPIRGL